MGDYHLGGRGTLLPPREERKWLPTSGGSFHAYAATALASHQLPHLDRLAADRAARYVGLGHSDGHSSDHVFAWSVSRRVLQQHDLERHPALYSLRVDDQLQLGL